MGHPSLLASTPLLLAFSIPSLLSTASPSLLSRYCSMSSSPGPNATGAMFTSLSQPPLQILQHVIFPWTKCNWSHVHQPLPASSPDTAACHLPLDQMQLEPCSPA